eukprot:gene12254-25757_t
MQLSVKKLQTILLPEVLTGIMNRSTKQLELLSPFKITRPVETLRYLYSDTIRTLDSFHTSNHMVIPLSKKHQSSMLESFEARHGMIIETLAEARQSLGQQASDFDLVIEEILWRQTSISTLLQQGLSLISTKQYYSSCVQENFNLLSLIEDVITEATILAEHHYNWSPEVIISTTPEKNTVSDNVNDNVNSSVTCTCIPSMHRFVLLEVLKNSLCATISRHHEIHHNYNHNDTQYEKSSPVYVCVSCDGDGITLVVSDKGVGLAPMAMDRVFKFLRALVEAQTSYQPAPRPMQGLGVGLSLAKEYATHFGGRFAMSSGGLGCGATVEYTIPKDIDIEEDLERIRII